MDLYKEELLEQAKNPRHKGVLEGEDAQTTLVNASCGDAITVQLNLDNEGTITDLKWQGEGCIISQAAMSLLADHILESQLTLDEVREYSKEQMLQLLGFEEISPGRVKCMLLGSHAIQKIVRERN